MNIVNAISQEAACDGACKLADHVKESNWDRVSLTFPKDSEKSYSRVVEATWELPAERNDHEHGEWKVKEIVEDFLGNILGLSFEIDKVECAVRKEHCS